MDETSCGPAGCVAANDSPSSRAAKLNGAMRARRLSRGDEFDSVYSKGTVISGPLLLVRVKRNEVGTTRWGFAVGKRLSKKAVVRNRLRRQLREAIRQLPVDEGWDIVVQARPKAMAATFAALREDLAQRLRRAGALAEAG